MHVAKRNRLKKRKKILRKSKKQYQIRIQECQTSENILISI